MRFGHTFAHHQRSRDLRVVSDEELLRGREQAIQAIEGEVLFYPVQCGITRKAKAQGAVAGAAGALEEWFVSLEGQGSYYRGAAQGQ
jgi:hypothetical protein